MITTVERQRFTLRDYLFTSILALAGIPMMLFGWYQGQTAYQDEINRSDQSDQLKAQLFAAELSTSLEARIQVVKSLAAALTPRFRDIQARRIRMRNELTAQEITSTQLMIDDTLRRSGYFDIMYVADANATAWFMSSSATFKKQLKWGGNYKDRDYFKAIQKSHQVELSRVQRGKRSKRPNIQIVAPILSSQQELIGFTEGSVDLIVVNQKTRLLTSKDPALRVQIIDHLGQVITDSRQRLPDLSLHPLSEKISIQSHTANNHTFVIQDHDEDGRLIRSILHTITIRGLRWHIILQRAISSIEKEARSAAINALIPALALTLLIALGALLLARRLTTDIELLRIFLARLGHSQTPEEFNLNQLKLQTKEWRSLAESSTLLSAKLHEGRLQNKRSLHELTQLNLKQTSLLAAIEQLDDLIIITDWAGIIHYMNHLDLDISNKAYQRFKLNERCLLWNNTKFIGTSESIELRNERRASLLNNRPWHGQLRVSNQGIIEAQGEYTLTIDLYPIFEGQQISRVILIQRDITEELKIHEQLNVNERMASLGMLASGVAHEVNNPLTCILSNLEFAQEELELLTDNNHQVELITQFISDAVEGAEQVERVAKGLLDISRHDTDTELISIAEVLLTCLRILKVELNKKVTLTTDISDVGSYFGRGSELSQVVINLISNALHAMEDLPKTNALLHISLIAIDQADHSQWAILEISDQGGGIPKEIQSRIFDPFFTTKRRGVGTGLGLSLCLRMINDVGGSLDFKSKEGVGTTFVIRLPLAEFGDQQAGLESVSDLNYKDLVE